MTNQPRTSYLYDLFSRLVKRLSDYYKSGKNTDKDIKHKLRVTEELRDAGFNALQLRNTESRRLAGIIEDNEHIMAAICGHTLLNGVSVIAATNKRVIYINHHLFTDTLDEFNYISISGISYSTNGFFWSVTMHSGLGDRTLERIRGVQAKKFVGYIESLCIDRPYEI